MDSIEIVPMGSVKRALSGRSLMAAALLATGLAMGYPANASAGMGGAEKLYQLNAMLSAMEQRCRSTPDNFTAEYASFTDSHVAELNQADAEFRARLTARYGGAGVKRVVDGLNRSMANGYAKGHPWLDCAQLKMATRNLIGVIGRDTLEEAADQLIGNHRPSRFAEAQP